MEQSDKKYHLVKQRRAISEDNFALRRRNVEQIMSR